ncbi:hypothetical protein Hgul01_05313 [Herpetosiphon gulosus]|uniref:DUF2029 domain-containing protein n=2 Tax=Herpetosiphon gulosus TaxID=1973496 RepID=A0ABP9XA89_9CHLR
MRPLAMLPWESARLIWFVGNSVLLGVCLGQLGRWINASWKRIVVTISVCFMIPAFYDTLLLGQINIILLALLLLHFRSLEQAQTARSRILSGMILGITAGIKIFPVFFAIPLMLRRQWAACVGVCLGGIATLGIGMIGSGTTATTIQFVQDILLGLEGTNIADQSVWDVMGRLFEPHTFTYAYQSATNKVTVTLQPLIDAGWVGTLIGTMIFLLIIGVTIRTRVQQRSYTNTQSIWLDGSMSIILVMLFLPVVHDHYLSLLLIPGFTMIRYGADWVWSKPQYLMIGGLILGALILQRYWRVLLNIYPSPLVLAWGFLATSLLWGMYLYWQRNGPITESQK